MSIARGLLTGGAMAVLGTGCVQKAYERTVVYELDVSALDSVKTVGLRGDNLPLSWQQDQAMTAVVADSLYRTTVTYRTGYRATEVKFTVNGTFEFDNGDNRRVPFEMNGDTTIYRARFNVRP
jgi:hypothetical protein